MEVASASVTDAKRATAFLFSCHQPLSNALQQPCTERHGALGLSRAMGIDRLPSRCPTHHRFAQRPVVIGFSTTIDSRLPVPRSTARRMAI